MKLWKNPTIAKMLKKCMLKSANFHNLLITMNHCCMYAFCAHADENCNFKLFLKGWPSSSFWQRLCPPCHVQRTCHQVARHCRHCCRHPEMVLVTSLRISLSAFDYAGFMVWRCLVYVQRLPDFCQSYNRQTHAREKKQNINISG